MYVKSVSVQELDNKLMILITDSPILISRNESKVQLATKGPIFVNWYAYVHELLYNLFKSFRNTIEKFEYSKSSAQMFKPKQELYVDLAQEVLIHMYLETQCLIFLAKSMILSLERGNETLVQLPFLGMGLKAHPNIVKLSQLSVTFEENSSAARCDIEDPVSSCNDCYKITLLSCDVAIPFQVDVHSAISNEFLGVVKWLKMVHQKKSSKSSEKKREKISADILIYMKNFSFLLSDDPFEVKLRENFELIEDEYLESAKREVFLDSKIEELRKTHITLPTAKVT